VRGLPDLDKTGADAAGKAPHGFRPRLVVGALENFKLTVASDFELARRLLETRA